MPKRDILDEEGLEPEERLFVSIVRLAIDDARQSKNEKLRAQALGFLWSELPEVATKLKLPQVAVNF